MMDSGLSGTAGFSFMVNVVGTAFELWTSRCVVYGERIIQDSEAMASDHLFVLSNCSIERCQLQPRSNTPLASSGFSHQSCCIRSLFAIARYQWKDPQPVSVLSKRFQQPTVYYWKARRVSTILHWTHSFAFFIMGIFHEENSIPCSKT